MYSIHAARHCHSFTLLRQTLITARIPVLHHVSLKTLARPQSAVQQCLPALRRSVSTQSPTSAAAKAQLGRMIASLDFLNVYQAGQARTVFVGMCRMVTIVVFGLGVFVVAPRMYFDPDTSMWWVPGVIVGAAVPLVMVAILSAPFVSAVRVLLPGSAKRSHDALMKFAENVPQDTKVLFQTMRWLPWPTHKEVFFGDLRRLTGRRISANLEHVPLGHEKAHKASQIMGGRLATRMYEKYWVDMSARNKSRAPGVWEKMWDQITIKGQESLKVAPKDRSPPAMANRPASSEGAGRKLASPPSVKPKKGARPKRSR